MSGRTLTTVRSRVGARAALALSVLLSAASARGEAPAATPPPSATPPAAPAPTAAAEAPAGQKPEETAAGLLFGARCTACHFIGEGRKVGPDLLGVTTRRPAEWITNFLTSPGKMLDSGDPVAAQLLKEANGVRMPEQDLKPEQIAELLQFFAACTVKGGCKPGPAVKLGIDGSLAEVEAGHDLALGLSSFSAGGPACIECHHFRGAGLLGGGTIGSDLTTSWGRLHDQGWADALGRSPLEKKVYQEHELTADEKFQLRVFFADLSRDGRREQPSGDFFDLGALGALALLGAIGVTWVARPGAKA